MTTQAGMFESIDDEPNNQQMLMFGNSPFNDVLKALEAQARSRREKGDLFEALTKAFLEQDSLYREQFTEVWLWNEWPLRDGRNETGIDLVAQNADDGEYTAIQCKFYAADQYVSKPDVDTFVTASGIVVTGGPRFTKRLFISTTHRWSQNAEEALLQEVPVARLGIADFENSSIDWTKYDIGTPATMIQREKKSPREHQREAIQAVLNGFQTHDRGKMIMACGTGMRQKLAFPPRPLASRSHAKPLLGPSRLFGWGPPGPGMRPCAAQDAIQMPSKSRVRRQNTLLGG